MIRYEDECCDCATPGYPCIGDSCPLKHVRRLYCDRCEFPAKKLYKYDSEELCEECLLAEFEEID